eukprot:6474978-Amphidinium_carterae.1
MALVVDQKTGTIKSAGGSEEQHADVSSDLLVYLALRRRGLALDQANVVDYETHEKWVDEMFSHRLREMEPN